MAPDLCPYCGRAAHTTNSNFDCLGRSDQKTVATGAPAFTPPVDPRGPSPSQSSDGFAALDAALGTKLTAGTKVGEYQVLARIGEGGMGTVYSAVHPIIGKKVAIKVLAARLAKNKNAISRFVLEARAVNDIQHPGLVDIFSFGQLTDGRHYYVMEFLEGRNLGDVLRERIRLPMVEAIPIFLEVGRALVAVHLKGIVHRDLKPENILLLAAELPGGQKVKLVDFGLAKLVDGVPAHLSEGGPRTAAGVNVGTPHYMSPEQCRGLKVDARADLYSLGVLLYETLTGRLPFDGPTALDIWQAHVERAPEPPCNVVPGAVSPALNAIILRLLAKQADHRIQTAGEFCAALEELGADGRGRPAAVPVPEIDVGSAARSAARLPLRQPGAMSTEELTPGVQLPEVAFTEEDRRKEIEELRASLGLHIEEPAADSQEGEQMSALVIDLGPSRASPKVREGTPGPRGHALPLVPAGPRVRRPSRPIEERKHVPPLAAPLSRVGGQARTTTEPPPPAPLRVWRIVRGVLVLAILVAATIAAVRFIK
ncbi:MAG TPA: serine/threonine-protein kinase [Polyangia bacterium]